jgi:hypothetical protein
VDEQWEAELLEYDQNIARANEIIGRLERDRLARGQESDSDLSILDSEQFEGIDISSDSEVAGDSEVKVSSRRLRSHRRQRGSDSDL